MRFVLDFLYLIGFILASPWFAWRALRKRASDQPGPRPELVNWPRGAIWLHGSSVGEVSLIRPLVERLRQERPAAPIVISSHTVTGVEAAARAYPEHRVFRLPPDFSFIQRRLLRQMQPILIVVVESDLWPNQLLAARAASVPVAVVNGKLSERSTRRHSWSRLVPIAMRDIRVVAVQNEEHAGRFERLGVPRERMSITGNMKYDLAADQDASELRSELRARLGCADDDVLILGGSLHLPEDQDLLSAFAAIRAGSDDAQTARLVIVPRYPKESGLVSEHVRAAGFDAVPYSATGAQVRAPPAKDQVVVVDVLGELRNLYAAADIAFVGGSLHFRGANKGGHNLMEPAILGIPVLFGPYNFSFQDTVADLLAADAGLLVGNADELQRELGTLVRDKVERQELGRRAREVVLSGQGATERNLELLLTMLDMAAACSSPKDDAQCRHQTSGHIVNE